MMASVWLRFEPVAGRFSELSGDVPPDGAVVVVPGEVVVVAPGAVVVVVDAPPVNVIVSLSVLLISTASKPAPDTLNELEIEVPGVAVTVVVR